MWWIELHDDDILAIISRVSKGLGQTTFILNGTDLHDDYHYQFIIESRLENDPITQISEGFHLWVPRVPYIVQDIGHTPESRWQSIAFLQKFYLFRLYFLQKPDSNQFSIHTYANKGQQDDNAQIGCCSADIVSSDDCGVFAVSYFDEENIMDELVSGIQIVLNVTKPCAFQIGHQKGDGSYQWHHFWTLGIATVNEDVFLNNINPVAVYETTSGHQSGFAAFINDTLTLRCLAPRCTSRYIDVGWCKLFNGAIDDFMIYLYYADNFTWAFDLTFSSLQANHSGTYICAWKEWAPGGGGYGSILQTRNSTFKFQVEEQQSPLFTDNKDFQVEKITLKRGDKLTLACQVKGWPPPDLLWTWTIDSDQKKAPRIIDYPANTTLEISESGRYECTAENRFGENNRTFEVNNDDQQFLSYLVVEIAVPVVLAFFSICVILIWYIRRRSIDASFKELARLIKNPPEPARLDETAFLNDQLDAIPYNKNYEISRNLFNLSTTILGKGEFGNILKGELKIDGHSGLRTIAIKVPRDLENLQCFRALVDELKIMSHIHPHVNVLSLVGACTTLISKKQLFVLTEFCEHGSLRDYLIANYIKFEGFEVNSAGQFIGTPDAINCLLKYAYQAANGMEYLSADNVIHRDLALRNLLLTSNHILKISDFGMSRRHKTAYRKRLSPDLPIPIFWMALESLINDPPEYSQKSDVWSFGIVSWEMFSCGQTPYADHEPDATFRTWLKKEENRLGPPKIACEDMWLLMQSCWKANPDVRPTFSQCKRRIARIIEQRSPSLYKSILLALSDAWYNLSYDREKPEMLAPQTSNIDDQIMATAVYAPAIIEENSMVVPVEINDLFMPSVENRVISSKFVYGSPFKCSP